MRSLQRLLALLLWRSFYTRRNSSQTQETSWDRPAAMGPAPRGTGFWGRGKACPCPCPCQGMTLSWHDFVMA